MSKDNIILYISDLLKKVELSQQSNKYQYIIQIYDCLKENKDFVKNHNNFYLAMKKNAKSLVIQIKNKLDDPLCSEEDKQNLGKTLFSIINCINTIDTIELIPKQSQL